MRASFLLLALVACQSDSTLVALVPDLPETATHLGILILSEEGRLITSSPLIPRTSVAAESAFEIPDEPGEVIVVAYSATQLDPGRLPSPPELSKAPLRFANETEPVLPVPFYAVHGEPSREAPLAPLSPVRPLTADWLAPCARQACERLQLAAMREVEVRGETREPSRWSVTLPGRRSTLFFTEDPNTPAYRFTPPDRIEVATASISGLRMRGVELLADGRVAVLLEDGQVQVDAGDGTFGPIVGPLPSTRARDFAAARFGDPLEIYVQDELSNIYTLSSTSWRLFHEAGLESAESQEIEWLGPQELGYVAPEVDRIAVVGPEGVRRVERLSSIRSLVYAEGWGPVIAAGSINSELAPTIFVLEEAGLRPLETGVLTRAPLAVWTTIWPKQIFFGGTNGEVTYFHEQLGVCALERYTSGGLRGVRAMEDGLLILPGRKGDNMYEGDTRVYSVPFAAPPLPACETAYRPAQARPN